MKGTWFILFVIGFLIFVGCHCTGCCAGAGVHGGIRPPHYSSSELPAPAESR